MRLTKLEMLGFKSFADPTVMLFDQGVTAIVGPNGCGKSNVSDAVRWVLGEQRARILRGAKMEEVIFQGSSARRAVNVAEVSLVFENSSGGLPVPFREVVVTRRLSRSGESDYLLNGAPCRLRDIHDLVRGTGLGADSGVVIEQRMIDALLSDRPDERRELFEEAAGVGLYRERRRSTERRLEETAHDIARLDDLINEVQSQVRSLARQRKRAERHKDLTARRFVVELTLAARDMQSWRDELQELEAQVKGLRESVPALERAVREAERARDDAHDRRAAAEAHRNEMAHQVASLRDSVQTLRASIAVSEERHRNTLQRRQRAADERHEGHSARARLEGELARAGEERAARAREMAGAEERLRACTADEATARAAVHEARSMLEETEQTLRALRDRVRELELQRDSTDRELLELESRARKLHSERDAIAETAQALGRELDGARAEQDVARRAVEGAARQLDQARATARLAQDHDVIARTEFAETEGRYTALQGRVQGLESLERERVGLAPAAVRLLRERDRFGDGAVLGPLSDYLTASTTSAAAVERFLGMSVHAVIVRDRAAADTIRAWHASVNPGPLLLLPLDSVPIDTGSPEGDLLAGIDAAPEAQGWIRVFLERVRTLHDGAFIDARGAVWLPGSTAGPGPLRRRAELFALRAELADAEAARAAASRAADEARSAFLAAESDVARRVDQASEAVEGERATAEALADLERRTARSERDLHDALTLATRMTTRTEELTALRRDSDVRLAELVYVLGEQDERVVAMRQGLTEAEERADSAREERTAAQVTVAQVQARLQVAGDREHRVEEDRVSASRRLDTLEQELVSLDDAGRELAEQMAAWQADLAARSATQTDAEARLTAAEQSVADADAALAAADHELDGARRQSQERADNLHHAELRYTELAGRRAAIRERLETEWKRSLDDMLAAVEPLDVEEDALRVEAETLRQQLEALGPVNPMAIEEHDEELKRLEFLTTQRADLHDARNSLQQVIREIDTTARELFLSTFTQVRENFHRIFMTLFGGGECDLRLENPEAPLDCDIEIHASPRGKRTQRIHLLSSGERALVALSLLFGIFLTKPSPFCLLDEVDAPLDDANIGRFVRMLNEFKQKTQFIVITHNPRTTTEAADAVYGITMQDPGVSSVVSVRMRGSPVDESEPDDAIEDRELAAAPSNEEVALPL